MSEITRDEAFALLKKYNKEEFHIKHGETVEGVMRYFAQELGYGDETEFWGTVGLLHDSFCHVGQHVFQYKHVCSRKRITLRYRS